MIITRTPFRVSFAGGGSDLPSFYQETEGCVLSTTINKYFYLSVRPCFNTDDIVLKYSEIETAQRIEDIQHPIFKSVLGDLGLQGVEIVAMPDIPSGMGLGSSSSFTVGLFHALHAYQGRQVSKETLAQLACETELKKLALLGGKQDQYAAAYGGLNFITFYPDDSVKVEPVQCSPDVRKALADNLLMFYVGGDHFSGVIHKEQDKGMKEQDKRDNVKRMAALAREMRDALERGSIDDVGEMLHEGWRLKRTLASAISNEGIDHYYEMGLEHGATGGKLLGAGGGGFILFYCPLEKQQCLREAFAQLKEIPFNFDTEGSKVLYNMA